MIIVHTFIPSLLVAVVTATSLLLIVQSVRSSPHMNVKLVSNPNQTISHLPRLQKRRRNNKKSSNQASSTCGKTVTPVSGDTCFDIAQSNNISLNKLKSLNKSTDCSNLQVGDTLCIEESNGGGGSKNKSIDNNNSNGAAAKQEINVALGQSGQQFCSSQFPGISPGDGTQNKQGQCSFTVQGAIPSFDQMTSTLIIKPDNAETVDNSKDVAVEISIA